jgi:hypothetical protein
MHIYKVTCKINQKIYIGLSTKKVNPHYFGSGKLITAAIKKYGITNFTKEILEYFDNKDYLVDAEKRYIKLYNSDDPMVGYNLSPGGDLNPDKQRVSIWQYDIEGNLIKYYTTVEDAINEINDRNLYRNFEINKRPVKGFWFSKSEKSKDQIIELHKLYLENRSLKFKEAANKRWQNKEYRKKMIENIKEARSLVKSFAKSNETKLKISNSIKGKHWYNNGEIESQLNECPLGWFKGRLR